MKNKRWIATICELTLFLLSFVLYASVWIISSDLFSFIPKPLSSEAWLLGEFTLLSTFIFALEAKWLGQSSSHLSQGLFQEEDLQLPKEWGRQLLKYSPVSAFIWWAIQTNTADVYFTLTCHLILSAIILWWVISFFSYFRGYEFSHNRLLNVQIKTKGERLGRFAWPSRLLGISSVLAGGLAIALPNFVGGCGGPSVSSIKANMHTLQTIVETYAMDSRGIYPESIEVLEQEAQKGNAYWKEFRNPITGYSGKNKSFANDGSMKPIEGLVTYKVSPDFKHYDIYGYDKHAEPLMNTKERVSLSNG